MMVGPGNFPEHMMAEGKDVSKYFNSKGIVFERTEDGEGFVYVQCAPSAVASGLWDGNALHLLLPVVSGKAMRSICGR